MAMGSKVAVMIVDDQQIMREGLETLLTHKSEFTVAGLAGSGEEALSMAASCKPDIVLMDIRMPGMGGVEAVKRFKESYPEIVILILTTFDDDAYIIEALSNGASGYLLKDIGSEKLIESIYEALSGNLLLTGHVARKLALSAMGSRPTATPAPNTAEAAGAADDDFGLTSREREIAGLMAEGYTSKEIAQRLFLTQGTVKNYTSGIYAKIGTNDRAKALLVLKNGQFSNED